MAGFGEALYAGVQGFRQGQQDAQRRQQIAEESRRYREQQARQARMDAENQRRFDLQQHRQMTMDAESTRRYNQDFGIKQEQDKRSQDKHALAMQSAQAEFGDQKRLRELLDELSRMESLNVAEAAKLLADGDIEGGLSAYRGNAIFNFAGKTIDIMDNTGNVIEQIPLGQAQQYGQGLLDQYQRARAELSVRGGFGGGSDRRDTQIVDGFLVDKQKGTATPIEGLPKSKQQLKLTSRPDDIRYGHDASGNYGQFDFSYNADEARTQAFDTVVQALGWQAPMAEGMTGQWNKDANMTKERESVINAVINQLFSQSFAYAKINEDGSYQKEKRVSGDELNQMISNLKPVLLDKKLQDDFESEVVRVISDSRQRGIILQEGQADKQAIANLANEIVDSYKEYESERRLGRPATFRNPFGKPVRKVETASEFDKRKKKEKAGVINFGFGQPRSQNEQKARAAIKGKDSIWAYNYLVDQYYTHRSITRDEYNKLMQEFDLKGAKNLEDPFADGL